MSEILAYEATLARLEQQAYKQEVALQSHRDSLRSKLDLLKPVAEIDAESVQALAFEFCRDHTEYLGTLHQITSIRKILGR